LLVERAIKLGVKEGIAMIGIQMTPMAIPLLVDNYMIRLLEITSG